MWEKVSKYIERHIKLLGALLVITVIVLWLLSQLFPVLQNWMQSQGLLNVIAVVLLVDVLTRLVEMKYSTRKSISVFAEQYESYRVNVLEFIRKTKPRKVDLIEYSTATISDLLLELTKNDCKIRLLIQHPDMAVNQDQKERININIRDIYRRISKNYDAQNVEVRCYCTSASVRGRNFDDKLVIIGWYTYFFVDSIGQTNIRGDTNPVVSAYVSDTETELIRSMFNDTFNDLWNHPSTVSLGSPPWQAPIPPPLIYSKNP